MSVAYILSEQEEHEAWSVRQEERKPTLRQTFCH